MTKSRKCFVVIWCVLSIIGIIFPNASASYIGFLLLGFHTPRDSILYFGLYSQFSDHPEVALISILLFFIFIVIWIITLIKIKRRLFEHLIIIDSIIALCRLVMCMFILKNDFVGWGLLIGLVIMNIFFVGAFIMNLLFSKKKTKSDAI